MSTSLVGRTASISAAFGHGDPQPPGGVATVIVGRSATQLLQRLAQCAQAGTSLAHVERLGQVEPGQHHVGVAELSHGLDREGGGSQDDAACVVAGEPELTDETLDCFGPDVAVDAVDLGEP